MIYSEFNKAIDSFDGKGTDIVLFISKVCGLSIYIASMLYNTNKHKDDCNIRIYKSLPPVYAQTLRDFKDFKLTVDIEFNYECRN